MVQSEAPSAKLMIWRYVEARFSQTTTFCGSSWVAFLASLMACSTSWVRSCLSWSDRSWRWARELARAREVWEKLMR